ncbi:MAG: class I SAM-dependent methyltransferase [Candidatus Nitrosopumilus sp. bin_6a]
MKIKKMENEIIDANLKFFKHKAKDYNLEEPSYKPENIKRVKKYFKGFLIKKNNPKILDIGCGTGFVIDIAKKFSTNVIGIDISNEMLKEVNKKGNVELARGNTSVLPFRDNFFDICTSYGFLHHLYDLTPTLKEAYRCLKKNGIFYSDQDPNYYYWENGKQFDPRKIENEFLKNEVIHVNDPTDGYKKKKMKSLNTAGKKTIIKSEYQKTAKGGFKEEEIRNIMKKIGFRKIFYNYEWYLGEGFVKHEISKNTDHLIKEHLQKCLPLSRNLFKYVRIIAIK